MRKKASTAEFQRSSTVLVMKGGGIKGLAYVGALEVLTERYRFGRYVGTSAGAITALLLAAGYTTDELERILREKNFLDFLDARWWQKPLNFVFHAGLHHGHTFVDWMDELLATKLESHGRVKMADLPTRATVFASRKEVSARTFDSECGGDDAAHAARCSMSIPLLFVPQSDQGFRTYDGGLQQNFPVKALLEEDPNVDFLALYLGPETYRPRRNKWPFLDWLSIWTESQDPGLIRKYRARTICIDPAPIGTLDFDITETEKSYLLEAGRAAALAHLESGSERHQLAVSRRDARRVEVESIRERRAAKKRLRRWSRIAVATFLMVTAVWLLLCQPSLQENIASSRGSIRASTPTVSRGLPPLPPRSIEELKKLSKVERYDFLISRGLSLLETHDYEAASLYLRHAMSISTDNGEDVIVAASTCRLRSSGPDYQSVMSVAQGWLSDRLGASRGKPEELGLRIRLMSVQAIILSAQHDLDGAIKLARRTREMLEELAHNLPPQHVYQIHVDSARVAYETRFLAEAGISADAALKAARQSKRKSLEIEARGERAKIKFLLGLTGEASDDVEVAIRFYEVNYPNDRLHLNPLYDLRANISRLNHNDRAARVDNQKCITWEEAKSTPDERLLVRWKLTRARLDKKLRESDLVECARWLAKYPQEVILQEEYQLAKAEVCLDRWTGSDPDEALTALTKAIELVEARSPADFYRKSEILTLRGATLRWQNRLGEAEDAYDRSILMCRQQNPVSNLNTAKAYAGRARVRQLLRGRLKDALADIDNAVSFTRNIFSKGQWERRILLLGLRASILNDIGSTDEASSCLEEAMRLCGELKDAGSYPVIHKHLMAIETGLRNKQDSAQ